MFRPVECALFQNRDLNCHNVAISSWFGSFTQGNRPTAWFVGQIVFSPQVNLSTWFRWSWTNCFGVNLSVILACSYMPKWTESNAPNESGVKTHLLRRIFWTVVSISVYWADFTWRCCSYLRITDQLAVEISVKSLNVTAVHIQHRLSNNTDLRT